MTKELIALLEQFMEEINEYNAESFEQMTMIRRQVRPIKPDSIGELLKWLKQKKVGGTDNA